MASQFKLPEELRSTEGINYWAKCYTNDQTIVKQFVEQYLIGLKDTVLTRNSHGGYLHKDELYDLVHWKSSRSARLINDSEPVVKQITGEAFGLDDDWKKLNKLTDLKGVGKPVASAILHFYDKDDYPILDKHALCTLGINHREVNYDEPFWRRYVDFCRKNAKHYDVSMRTLDRALWKYSASGAVAEDEHPS